MSEVDGLKKDWIVLLVSTSGILLAILGATIGVYHQAAPGRHWQLAVVDVLAVSAMGAFTWTIRVGLQALGALILALEAAEESDREKSAEVVRRRAADADRWFRRGVLGAALTAVAAVIAIGWIG